MTREPEVDYRFKKTLGEELQRRGYKQIPGLTPRSLVGKEIDALLTQPDVEDAVPLSIREAISNNRMPRSDYVIYVLKKT